MSYCRTAPITVSLYQSDAALQTLEVVHSIADVRSHTKSHRATIAKIDSNTHGRPTDSFFVCDPARHIYESIPVVAQSLSRSVGRFESLLKD